MMGLQMPVKMPIAFSFNSIDISNLIVSRSNDVLLSGSRSNYINAILSRSNIINSTNSRSNATSVTSSRSNEINLEVTK